MIQSICGPINPDGKFIEFGEIMVTLAVGIVVGIIVGHLAEPKVEALAAKIKSLFSKTPPTTPAA